MNNDLKIAQAAKLENIYKIAEAAGIDELNLPGGEDAKCRYVVQNRFIGEIRSGLFVLRDS